MAVGRVGERGIPAVEVLGELVVEDPGTDLQVAGDLRSVLGLGPDVEVVVLEGDDGVAARRRLAESHDGDRDVLILEQGCQTADLPALELHRAVLGRTGEFRAGPVDTEFDRRFARPIRQRRQSARALMSNDVDRQLDVVVVLRWLATSRPSRRVEPGRFPRIQALLEDHRPSRSPVPEGASPAPR